MTISLLRRQYSIPWDSSFASISFRSSFAARCGASGAANRCGHTALSSPGLPAASHNATASSDTSCRPTRRHPLAAGLYTPTFNPVRANVAAIREATYVFPTAVSVPTTNNPAHAVRRAPLRLPCGVRRVMELTSDMAICRLSWAHAVLTHPLSQDLWHEDTAVSLLIVLNHRNQCPANRDRRAVERVNKLRSLLTL